MVNQSTMLLMICIGSLILILAVLILFHQNATATTGYRLRTLERERSLLHLKEEVLNMQIAQAQALEHLREDARIAGMPPVGKPRYAQGAESVAAR